MSGAEWCHFFGCRQNAEPWRGLLTDTDPAVPLCIGHQTRIQQIQRGRVTYVRIVRKQDSDGHVVLMTQGR